MDGGVEVRSEDGEQEKQPSVAAADDSKCGRGTGRSASERYQQRTELLPNIPKHSRFLQWSVTADAEASVLHHSTCIASSMRGWKLLMPAWLQAFGNLEALAAASAAEQEAAYRHFMNGGNEMASNDDDEGN